MAPGKTESLTLYPRKRDGRPPGTERSPDLFAPPGRHRLRKHVNPIEVVEPELGKLREKILASCGFRSRPSASGPSRLRREMGCRLSGKWDQGF
jgi:hypothetical protein